jgi:hypothetical protein
MILNGTSIASGIRLCPERDQLPLLIRGVFARVLDDIGAAIHGTPCDIKAFAAALPYDQDGSIPGGDQAPPLIIAAQDITELDACGVIQAAPRNIQTEITAIPQQAGMSCRASDLQG